MPVVYIYLTFYPCDNPNCILFLFYLIKRIGTLSTIRRANWSLPLLSRFAEILFQQKEKKTVKIVDCGKVSTSSVRTMCLAMVVWWTPPLPTKTEKEWYDGPLTASSVRQRPVMVHSVQNALVKWVYTRERGADGSAARYKIHSTTPFTWSPDMAKTGHTKKAEKKKQKLKTAREKKRKGLGSLTYNSLGEALLFPIDYR